jgi:RNA recognition motif-containing protein
MLLLARLLSSGCPDRVTFGPADWMTIATKEDVRNHFASHSPTVKINEIKLMSGFGFIEFEDELDAREIVPGLSSYPCRARAC